VLDAGIIVEIGTHEELLSKKVAYIGVFMHFNLMRIRLNERLLSKRVEILLRRLLIFVLDSLLTDEIHHQ